MSKCRFEIINLYIILKHKHLQENSVNKIVIHLISKFIIIVLATTIFKDSRMGTFENKCWASKCILSRNVQTGMNSLRNKWTLKSRMEASLFVLFVKLIQITHIFLNNVHILYMLLQFVNIDNRKDFSYITKLYNCHWVIISVFTKEIKEYRVQHLSNNERENISSCFITRKLMQLPPNVSYFYKGIMLSTDIAKLIKSKYWQYCLLR